MGEYPYKLALADYDGDLRVDVAVLMRTSDAVWLYRGQGDGTFEVLTSTSIAVFPFDLVAGTLRGNGDGTFQPGVQYYAGGLRPLRELLADLDGDSRLDVLLLNARSNRVSALAGDGAGHLAPPAACAATDEVGGSGSNLGTLVVGRFDGDARPDIAVVRDTGISLLFNVTGAKR